MKLKDPTGKTNRKGYILMTAALTITGLVGVMALAVDVGTLQLRRRQAQTAADAGAIAAIKEWSRNSAITGSHSTSDIAAMTAAVQTAAASGNEEQPASEARHSSSSRLPFPCLRCC